MDGCPFEDTLSLSFLLSSLEVFHLKDDREVFYQEDATKDRYQQFLVDDDSKYGNDATNGQAACISHKYLRREGIVPEEADQRTDEGTDEDNEFFTARNEHDVQIAGIFDVTRNISQYT